MHCKYNRMPRTGSRDSNAIYRECGPRLSTRYVVAYRVSVLEKPIKLTSLNNVCLLTLLDPFAPHRGPKASTIAGAID